MAKRAYGRFESIPCLECSGRRRILAGKVIVKNRPDAIVAVACELDLTTEMQDSDPLPVIGILNDRPNGPCINTEVNIEKTRDGILSLPDSPKRSSRGSSHP